MQIQDIEALIESLNDQSPFLRETAIRALIEIGVPAILPIISTFKESWMYPEKWGGIEALCKIGEPAIQPLINALADEDKMVRHMAFRALCQMGDTAIAPLVKALEDGDYNQRFEASEILQNYPDYKQKYFREIMQVSNRYFQQLTDIISLDISEDDFYARVTEIFKNGINRYGEQNLIRAGLDLITSVVTDINLSDLIKLSEGDQIMGNSVFTMEIQEKVALMALIVGTLGEKGIGELIKLMDSQDEDQDEDIATLAVSCFNKKLLNYPQAIPKLKSAFTTATGTTYKLNIVLVLHTYGEYEFGESFLRECGLSDVNEISRIAYLDMAKDGNMYASYPFWRKNRH